MKKTVTVIALASAIFTTGAIADQVSDYSFGTQIETASHYVDKEQVQVDSANLTSLPFNSEVYSISK